MSSYSSTTRSLNKRSLSFTFLSFTAKTNSGNMSLLCFFLSFSTYSLLIPFLTPSNCDLTCHHVRLFRPKIFDNNWFTLKLGLIWRAKLLQLERERLKWYQGQHWRDKSASHFDSFFSLCNFRVILLKPQTCLFSPIKFIIFSYNFTHWSNYQ